MKPKKKSRQTVLFWIKSSRGTDRKAIFELPASYSKEDIESRLHEWCSCFGAWTASGNVVHYGYRSIRVPNRKDLKKQWDLCGKKKSQIEEKWSTLAAMWNIRRWDESNAN